MPEVSGLTQVKKNSKGNKFSILTSYNTLFEEITIPEKHRLKALPAKVSFLLKHDESKREALQEFALKYSPSKNYSFLFPGEEKISSEDQKFNFASDIDSEIKTCFEVLNDQFQYFDNSGDWISKYTKCYKAFKFMQIHEDGLTEELVKFGAYKALIFFDGNLWGLDQVIKTSMKSFPEPVHDIAIKDIPILDEIDTNLLRLSDWQNLISNTKDGSVGQILDAFQHSQKLAQTAGWTFPKNTKELKSQINSLLTYDDGFKNPEMAKIFGYYKIASERFTKALKFVDKFPSKTEDNIPDIVISDGNYHLVKLPIGDPRALILGDITGCCQSFDNHSHMCVEDGVTRPNNGFYLFLRATSKDFNPNKIDWANLEDSVKIVGQSYVWLSKSDNFTMDSLEFCAGKESKDVTIKSLLQKMSQGLFENPGFNIERVTLGSGGGTQSILGAAMEKTISENMLEGRKYGDSVNQYEISVSHDLQKARDDIAKLTGKDIPIIQVKDLQTFEAVDEKTKIKLLEKSTADIIFNLLVYNIYSGNASDPQVTMESIVELKDPILFTKDSVINCYKEGYFSFEDLAKINDAYLIEALTSDNAQKCYKNGFLAFRDLAKINEAGQIQVLTSDNAQKCYIKKYTKFETLSELNLFKVQALTSIEAQKCYKYKYFTLDELATKTSDIYKIQVLTSRAARSCYDKNITPDDLLKIGEVNKMQALTILCNSYDNAKVLFNMLVSLSSEEEIRFKLKECENTDPKIKEALDRFLCILYPKMETCDGIDSSDDEMDVVECEIDVIGVDICHAEVG